MTLYEARTAATKRLESDQTVSCWYVMATGGFRKEYTLATKEEMGALRLAGWKCHEARVRKATKAVPWTIGERGVLRIRQWLPEAFALKDPSKSFNEVTLGEDVCMPWPEGVKTRRSRCAACNKAMEPGVPCLRYLRGNAAALWRPTIRFVHAHDCTGALS
jgi:hypothetical protein